MHTLESIQVNNLIFTSINNFAIFTSINNSRFSQVLIISRFSQALILSFYVVFSHVGLFTVVSGKINTVHFLAILISGMVALLLKHINSKLL